MKNIFEKILALITLIITFPFLFIICLVSYFDTKSFPIFCQKRGITLDNKLFYIYKIRTIKKIGEMEENNKRTFLLSTAFSKHVSRFGKFLRLTGIDELPQMINIIKGDMGLVGPRPLDLFDLNILKNDYPELHKQRAQIKLKPGIIGQWQLYGEREKGAENLLYWDKINEKNSHLFFYIKMILLTLAYAFFSNNKDDSVIIKKQ